jgi:hypothetical protein
MTSHQGDEYTVPWMNVPRKMMVAIKGSDSFG